MTKPFSFEEASQPAAPFSHDEAQGKAKGFASDAVNALKQGALQLPGAATGLADILAAALGFNRPFSRAADALGDATGFKPGQWAKDAEAGYSPATQVGKAAIDAAWEDPEAGALDVAKAYVQNPRVTALNAIQSVPAMLAGGVPGRVVGGVAGIGSSAARAAIGEGSMMAGQAMGEIDPTVDPQRAAAAATAVGAGGAALGFAGGRAAQRLGITDLDTAIAGGTGGAAGKAMPIYKRVPAGMVQEGVLEEAPQSAVETLAQNWAEEKPLTERLARNVTEGALAGGLMGAVGGFVPAGQPSVPVPPGTDENERIRTAPSGGETSTETIAGSPVPAPGQPGANGGANGENPSVSTPSNIEAERTGTDGQGAPQAPVIDPNAGPNSRAASIAVASTTPAADAVSVPLAPPTPTVPPLEGGQAPAAPATAATSIQGVQNGQGQEEVLKPGAGGDTLAPATASFATEDEAQAYIAQQRRAGGARIQALPMPRTDGTFGIAIKGTPDYTVAEFHKRAKELRASGVLDGDILNPTTGEPFKNRLQAGKAKREAGDGHEIVQLGESRFVVRKAAPASAPASDTVGSRAVPSVTAPPVSPTTVNQPQEQDRANQAPQAQPSAPQRAAQAPASPSVRPAEPAAAAPMASVPKERVQPASAPEPKDFTLTGSNRAVDVGAAMGQGDLLGNQPAAQPQPVEGPGADAGNGFKRGPVDGDRYRVGSATAFLGGAISFERRYPSGTAATFYVGKDGNLVDADDVNLIGSGKERLWIPSTPEQAEAAKAILDEMGRLDLADPARKDAKGRLKALVMGEPVSQPKPEPAKPTSEAVSQPETEAAPSVVRVKTLGFGDVHVRQSDLDGDRTMLPQYTADGKRKGGAIHRDNLDPDGTKLAKMNAEDSSTGVFDLIVDSDGTAFKTEAGAKRERSKRGLNDTHEVVSASEVVSGANGFVIRRSQQADTSVSQPKPEPTDSERFAVGRSLTKESRGPAASQAWVNEGMTQQQLLQAKADRLGAELAGIIREESSANDFAPTELAKVVQQWSDENKVPPNMMAGSVLDALGRYDFSEGRLRQIRKALEPVAAAKPASEAVSQPETEAPSVETLKAKLRDLDRRMGESPKTIKREGLKVEQRESSTLGFKGKAWYVVDKDGQVVGQGHATKPLAWKAMQGAMMDNPERGALLAEALQIAAQLADVQSQTQKPNTSPEPVQESAKSERVEADAQSTAQDNPFAKYDAEARTYGYEVRSDGAIGLDGKFPGTTIKEVRGRLRIESGAGNLMFSGAPTSESFGKFLRNVLGAEKETAKVAPQQSAPPEPKPSAPEASEGAADKAPYSDPPPAPKKPEIVVDKAEIRPYRKPDGSIGYEAVPIMPPTPVAVPEPKAKPTPSANTIFTEDAAAAARARLKAKLGRLNSGLDPETMLDGITLAGYHIEKGARTFAAYAKAMVEDLGDAVKPYLKSWYMGVRYDPRASGFDGMSSAAEVEAASVDTLDTPDEKAQNAKNGRDDATDSQPAVGQRDPGAVQGADGERGTPAQQPAAPDDSGNLEAPQPTDVPEPAVPPAGDATGVRAPGADVGPGAGTAGPGDAGDGRPGAGRKGKSAAGARGRRAAGPDPAVKAPESVSPANPGPGDFSIDDPLKIVGGGQVARFEKNKAAIELRNRLIDEGRMPTREEQTVLAGYTGWGSFGQELFQGSWTNPAPKAGWEARDKWLRENLGAKEWEGMQTSIINAHYTDPPTVLTMWDMVRRMGFTGGRVLEPSIGIGNFFGMMPADLVGRSQRAGIELDPVTGSMAQMLYPNANIQIKGYEASTTPDNFYDLVIGNWPFFEQGPADRRYNRLSPTLHDYFFLKAIDQTRPGGLVVGITSKGTMDKKGISARIEMARKAELVAAFRLPSGAFEEYAGTKVVTDIIILRKRKAPIGIVAKEGWIETLEHPTREGTPVAINEYFHKNPSHVIGEIDFGHGTTTFRPGLIVRRPANMMEQLRRIVELVPEGAFLADQTAKHISYVANHTKDRTNSLVDTPQGLFVVHGEHMAPAGEILKYELKDPKATQKRVDELKALVKMRQLYAELIDAERGAAGADTQRAVLRKAYEAFTKANGPMSKSFGLQYLRKLDDPFYPSLAALEIGIPGADGKMTYRPAKILSESTMRGARAIANPSISDAFVLARNESVNPSIARIAEISGKPEAEVRQVLVESGAGFEMPNGDFAPADIYLSGNVRAKLREAKAAVEAGNKAVQRNVEALQQVVPADIPYYKIETQMGATWVPPSTYAEFVGHMLGIQEGIEVGFQSGAWKIDFPSAYNHRAEATSGFGTTHVKFKRLVRAAIANQSITVKMKDQDGVEHVMEDATKEVNAKIADMRLKFGEWLWSDPVRRTALEAEYNEVRNAYADPKFDGSFLGFQGMALTLGRGPFNLREHQVNAIWRGLVTRKSLNAHEVGTGKTFTMGGIAVESRRYGIAKKPMLFAHNANSKSVAHEIQMMYPAAKVLYVDNLSKENLKTRMMQIANDDWDVIVMPHSIIDRIGFKESTLMGMAQEELNDLQVAAEEAASEDGVSISDAMWEDEDELKKLRSVTAKQLVKQRLTILTTIQKLAQQASKEDSVAFEDMGVDMLLVDEAHEFKKPPIATKMKLKGLQTQTSNRSIALMFLTKYVRANNNGANVHLFTGTPITNTMTEVFHMMRYMMQEEMKEVALADWDGWFGSFAREVNDVELTSTGEYEAVTRLQSFINVPELRRMIGQYMDVVFSDEMPEMRPRAINGKVFSDPTLTEAERAHLLNGRTENALDRPYKKVINESFDMSPDQQVVFAQVQRYAATWKNMSKKDRKDAMSSGAPESPLIHDGIATKASFDVRLVEAIANAGKEGSQKMEPHPDSKAARTIKNLLEVYRGHPQANQVVFMSQGMAKFVTRREGPVGMRRDVTYPAFSTMHDMIERLVAAGVPRDQIAAVDGSTSKDRRKEIADAMNTGQIRIVFGSTGSLGVGVNMQRNLRAMHHMDAPWMPGDLEQRNGRGHRQGNQWNTVLEFRYITDRLDGKRWQTLARKQKFITDFMKAKGDVRVIEGDVASEEEGDILSTFAEAAGDPRILLREKLKKTLEGLQSRERMHGIAQSDAAGAIKTEQREIESRTRALAAAGPMVKSLTELIDAQRGDGFTMTVKGVQYTKRAEAAEALERFAAEMRTGDEATVVGTYGPLTLRAQWYRFADAPHMWVTPQGSDISVAANGMSISSLESGLRHRRDNDIPQLEAQIARAKERMDHARKVLAEPFHMADKLAKTRKQLEDMERDIEANPVAPPYWLRNGAPIDTEVYRGGKPFTVTGHRWSDQGWFVVGSDEKGEVNIPYMQAKDAQGMPLYEEHEFSAPTLAAGLDVQRKALREAGLGEALDELLSFKSDGGLDDPALSRAGQQEGTTPAGRMTVEAARKVIDPIIAKWTNAPRVVVVAAPSDLPMQAPDDARGVYHQGTVYIVASGHNSGHSGGLMRTLAHEAVAHYGLRGLLGADGYQRFLNQMQVSMRMGNKALIEIRDDVRSRYGQLSALKEADEIAARAVELGVDQKTGEFKTGFGWLKAMFAKVAQALREFGITIPVTNVELQGMLVRAMRHVKGEPVILPAPVEPSVAFARQQDTINVDGKERPTTNSKGQPIHPTEDGVRNFWRGFKDSKVIDADGRPLVVYHGTTADFTRFDLQRGGAVTGAADAREGFFFASNPKAADQFTWKAGDKIGSIMPVYLSMQNPAYSDLVLTGGNGGAAAMQIKNAKAAGHDGIIFRDSDMVDHRGQVLVSFRPEQIKSATGNQGTYDPDSDDIRFARGAPDLGAVVTDIKRQAGNRLTDYRSLGLGLLGRRQLVDLYEGDLPQLRTYSNLVQRMDADKNEAGAEADELARRWGALKDEKALAELMHDSTLAQIDPTMARPRSDLAGDQTKYDQLREQFMALTPQAQAVYKDARDAYKRHHQKVRAAIRVRVLRSQLAGARKAEILARLDAEFFEAVKGVYFPLARFGDYVVIVRNNTGKVVTVNRAETMTEAEALRDHLRKEYPDMSVSKVLKDREFNAGRDSVGRGFMETLFAAFDHQDLSAAQRADIEDMLGQLYLSALPDLSWAKHGIHRKGTPGYSQDARRAFAMNMFHGARYLAKTRYSDLLDNELASMQKSVQGQDRNDGFDSVRAQQVIDEMVKRHESMMNPKGNALSTALTSAGFVFHLGLSPASALVNLSQTALVAFPIMGAKWGFAKASAALLEAAGLAAKAHNDLSGALKGDEKKAFDEAVRSGTIDVTMAHDLAGIAQGEDAKVAWKIRPVMRMASFLFHHAERFNRQVTFLAAYRLAREAGADHVDAYEQATQATYDGHFDYAASNRPRHMQGNVAKVLLLFKQYAQNMIYTMVRQADLSVNGTPAQKAEARKALAGLLAMHAAAAGVLGLPLVSPLLSVASMIGGGDDEPWDAEVALRNMLADAIGSKPAEVLTRGFSRLTPWDISARVGLDHLILPDVQEGLQGRRFVESAAAAFMGPVAGIGLNIGQGVQDIAQGHWMRGIETMMPTAIRGPLRAVRYANEGAIDKTGVPIVDEVGATGIAGQALGLRPSTVALAQEGKIAIYEADQRLVRRRSELMRVYAMAVIEADLERAQEARVDIQAFNEKNPTRRINPLQLAQSVRARRARIDQADQGVYLPKNRRDAAEAGRFALTE